MLSGVGVALVVVAEVDEVEPAIDRTRGRGESHAVSSPISREYDHLQVLLFGSLAVGLSVLGHLSIVGGVIAFPVMAACTYCCVSDLLEG